MRCSLLILALSFSPACGTGGAESSLPEGPLETNSQDLAASQVPSHGGARFEQFRAALQPRLDHHSADLEPHQPRANVTVLPLKHRFGHAVVARRGANGRLEYGCFADADQTAAFVTRTPGGAEQ